MLNIGGILQSTEWLRWAERRKEAIVCINYTHAVLTLEV